MRLNELLDVVFRWAHLIAGIMWIGNSMLFNWLDRNLIAPPADPAHRLSQGKIYMVHSGAFYEVEKKLLEPGELPDQLHWFKWQNGITWLTGISLLVIVYYMNGAAFLVDPSVRALSPTTAILISAGALVAGWAIYDTLWITLGRRAPAVATVLTMALLVGAAWEFTHLFSGRAAYIETGVLMGTIMTGNVWMRILPSQRSLIAATKAGQEQDATLSLRAKQRSIHNNYLTFPLLFIMISNHFPGTYGHHLRFYVLFVVMIAGAGVRHFMNVRYAGRTWLVPALAMAAVGIGGMKLLTSIQEKPSVVVTDQIGFARAQEIIVKRCTPCHSAHPTDDQFHEAPLGVMFDTPERIAAMAARIKERAVQTKTMPFLNKTKITEQERGELGAWIDQGAKLQ
ncbi:MAG TPA: urate hydroxylase PuuD [Kofleriaceae bacterium]|nr:urate hydroxylase PuuD [Kofleriaceae bacterium]